MQRAESYCPEFGGWAENSRGIGNPNDYGWPDDIPVRNGEPIAASSRADPDINADNTVGVGRTDTSGGCHWLSDPNPIDGNGYFGGRHGDDRGGGGCARRNVI